MTGDVITEGQARLPLVLFLSQAMPVNTGMQRSIICFQHFLQIDCMLSSCPVLG